MNTMNPVESARHAIDFLGASVRYEAANMTWQWGGDAEALRDLAQWSDVLILVECRTADGEPLDVQAILGDEWDVQQDLTDDAHAGSVTAYRINSGVKLRRTKLVPLSGPGHKVQGRFQRVSVFVEPKRKKRRRRIVQVNASHAPLPSTGRVAEARRRARSWVRAARSWVTGSRRVWLWGGDCNTDPKAWAKLLGAGSRVVGDKPMAIVWSSGWGNPRTWMRAVKRLDHRVLGIRRKKVRNV